MLQEISIRLALAYSLLGICAITGIAGAVYYARARYWHRLRQNGDARAKKREAARRKKRVRA